MWTTHNAGRIAPGEADIVCGPSHPRGKLRQILYVHGAGELGDGWMKIPSRIPLFDALTSEGFIITCPDLGGAQTWGSDLAQARISAAYAAMQSTPGALSGAVILVGQSMGGLNSVIWAMNNPGKVAAMILLMPVLNLDDVRQHSQSYAQLIDGAYAGGYVEAALGATRNPSTIARRGAAPRIPTQLWYGLDDLLCKPQFAVEYADQVGAELHSVQGGHAESTLAGVNQERLAAFAGRNARV